MYTRNSSATLNRDSADTDLWDEAMTSSDLVMIGSYDYRLVAVSVLIFVLGASAALVLAGRITAARRQKHVEV